MVDWVETSTGPAWLDAAHAASNLALAYGTDPAQDLLDRLDDWLDLVVRDPVLS